MPINQGIIATPQGKLFTVQDLKDLANRLEALGIDDDALIRVKIKTAFHSAGNPVTKITICD